MKSEIKKEDYYENMYDIENLTDLNKSNGKTKKSSSVLEIEKIIKNNRCDDARIKIRQFLLQKNAKEKDSRIEVLNGALWTKDRVFSEYISPDKNNLSPKSCAMKELSLYLEKTEKVIEKKMLVEKPVAEDWGEISPDPRSEKEISDFYIKTDSYIYELMAANHIIQTLYSYYVLSKKMQKLNIGSILDYGAGAGTLSIFFKNLGYDVIYADLPGKLYNFARWRFTQRKINIPMINLRKKPISSGQDCILSTEVIEHVVDPIKLLKLFKKNLRKNGILIVSESCEYTEDFSSHLESNKKYGGKNFIKMMSGLGFKQILSRPFIPQMIFIKMK